jgi:tetratricopeptide (TPR) repeat protein
MATASNIMLYRYSPENMDEAILRKLFVGRENLLKSVFNEIEDSARKKTPRFFLIVGPRGIGKSHFLVLLYHEIKNKLGSMLIPIKLREEEYSVYRASDLFLRILEEKKEDTKEILSLANEDEILHAAIEKFKLISKRDGKRFIIFIENLPELFRQLDLKELQKLRSIFQKNDFFSVVASAPMIFPGISEHDEPFYNFFQIQFLSEFSLEEIKDLMRKIADAENNTKFLDEFEKYEPKIHGLAHLTGGSPRLVILFYEMITRGELENIENAFFKIIDEHTPYYQEIFQLLTGQKRRIFDAVISSETPITPKQISKGTRLDLPTVTTQLRRLETDGYVISRPMGRSTKYEVRERLFRLWREMRQPLGRKRVSILLEFLQYWYTMEERKYLFKMKFELLEAGKKNVLKDLCYIAETLSPEYKTEARLKLTHKLIEFGEREEAEYEILKLKEAATQIKDKELEGKIPLYEGNLLISEKRYEEALKAFNKAIEIPPKDELIEIIIMISFNFSLDQIKVGNRGNAAKFMKNIYNISTKLKEDKVAILMINFLKSAADSGDIQVVKVAVDDIIKIFGNKYEERIKPIIKALEIIETKDIQKYYDLQIEEREIVGDIVKKITKSDKLLPEEIKKRETRLTDYATT